MARRVGRRELCTVGECATVQDRTTGLYCTFHPAPFQHFPRRLVFRRGSYRSTTFPSHSDTRYPTPTLLSGYHARQGQKERRPGFQLWRLTWHVPNIFSPPPSSSRLLVFRKAGGFGRLRLQGWTEDQRGLAGSGGRADEQTRAATREQARARSKREVA